MVEQTPGRDRLRFPASVTEQESAPPSGNGARPDPLASAGQQGGQQRPAPAQPSGTPLDPLASVSGTDEFVLKRGSSDNLDLFPAIGATGPDPNILEKRSLGLERGIFASEDPAAQQPEQTDQPAQAGGFDVPSPDLTQQSQGSGSVLDAIPDTPLRIGQIGPDGREVPPEFDPKPLTSVFNPQDKIDLRIAGGMKALYGSPNLVDIYYGKGDIYDSDGFIKDFRPKDIDVYARKLATELTKGMKPVNRRYAVQREVYSRARERLAAQARKAAELGLPGFKPRPSYTAGKLLVDDRLREAATRNALRAHFGSEQTAFERMKALGEAGKAVVLDKVMEALNPPPGDRNAVLKLVESELDRIGSASRKVTPSGPDGKVNKDRVIGEAVVEMIDSMGGPDVAKNVFADEKNMDLLVESVVERMGLDPKKPEGKLQASAIRERLMNAQYAGDYGPVAVYKRAGVEGWRKAIGDDLASRGIDPVSPIGQAEIAKAEIERVNTGDMEPSDAENARALYKIGAAVLPFGGPDFESADQRTRALGVEAGAQQVKFAADRIREAQITLAKNRERILAARKANKAALENPDEQAHAARYALNEVLRGGAQLLGGLATSISDDVTREVIEAKTPAEKAFAAANFIENQASIAGTLAYLEEHPNAPSTQQFFRVLAERSRDDESLGQAVARTFDTAADDPSGAGRALLSVMLESAYAAIPVAGTGVKAGSIGARAAGAVGFGGRVGAAVGSAAGTGAVTFATMLPREDFMAVQEIAGNAGFDLSDPNLFKRLADNPDDAMKLLDALRSAHVKAAVLSAVEVGLAAGISGAIAGKLGGKLGHAASEGVTEGVAGAAGEAIGGAVATGNVNVGEVAAEALLGGAAGSVGGITGGDPLADAVPDKAGDATRTNDGGQNGDGGTEQAGGETQTRSDKILSDVNDILQNPDVLRKEAIKASEKQSLDNAAPVQEAMEKAPVEVQKAVIDDGDDPSINSLLDEVSDIARRPEPKDVNTAFTTARKAVSSRSVAGRLVADTVGTPDRPGGVSAMVLRDVARRDLKDGTKITAYVPVADKPGRSWSITPEGMKLGKGPRGGELELRLPGDGAQHAAIYRMRNNADGSRDLLLAGFRKAGEARGRFLDAPVVVGTLPAPKGTVATVEDKSFEARMDTVEATKQEIADAADKSGATPGSHEATAVAPDRDLPGSRVLATKLASLSALRDAAFVDAVWSGTKDRTTRRRPTRGTLQSFAILRDKAKHAITPLLRHMPRGKLRQVASDFADLVAVGRLDAAEQLAMKNKVDPGKLEGVMERLREDAEKGSRRLKDVPVEGGLTLSDFMASMLPAEDMRGRSLLAEVVPPNELRDNDFVLGRDAAAVGAWLGLVDAVRARDTGRAADQAQRLATVLSDALMRRITDLSPSRLSDMLVSPEDPASAPFWSQLTNAVLSQTDDPEAVDLSSIDMPVANLMRRLDTPGDPLVDTHLMGKTLTEWFAEAMPRVVVDENGQQRIVGKMMDYGQRDAILYRLSAMIDSAVSEYILGNASPREDGVETDFIPDEAVQAMAELPSAVIGAMNGYVDGLFQTRIAIERLTFVGSVLAKIAKVEQAIGTSLDTGVLTTPIDELATLTKTPDTVAPGDPLAAVVESPRVEMPDTVLSGILDIMEKQAARGHVPFLSTAKAVLDNTPALVADIDEALSMAQGLDVPLVHGLYVLGQALKRVPETQTRAAIIADHVFRNLPQGMPPAMRGLMDLVADDGVLPKDLQRVYDNLAARTGGEAWELQRVVAPALFERAVNVAQAFLEANPNATRDEVVQHVNKSGMADAATAGEAADEAHDRIQQGIPSDAKAAIETADDIVSDVQAPPDTATAMDAASAMLDAYSDLAKVAGVKDSRTVSLADLSDLDAEAMRAKLVDLFRDAEGNPTLTEAALDDKTINALVEALADTSNRAGMAVMLPGGRLVLGIADDLDPRQVVDVTRHELAHLLIMARLSSGDTGHFLSGRLKRSWGEYIINQVRENRDLIMRLAPEDMTAEEAVSEEGRAEIMQAFTQRIRDMKISFPEDFMSTSQNFELNALLSQLRLGEGAHPAEWLATAVSDAIAGLPPTNMIGKEGNGILAQVRFVLSKIRDAFKSLPVWMGFNIDNNMDAASLAEEILTGSVGEWHEGAIVFMSRSQLSDTPVDNLDAIEAELSDLASKAGVALRIIRHPSDLLTTPPVAASRVTYLHGADKKGGSPTLYVNALVTNSASRLMQHARSTLATDLGLHAVMGQQYKRLVTMLGAGAEGSAFGGVRVDKNWMALRRQARKQLRKEGAADPTPAEIGRRMLAIAAGRDDIQAARSLRSLSRFMASGSRVPSVASVRNVLLAARDLDVSFERVASRFAVRTNDPWREDAVARLDDLIFGKEDKIAHQRRATSRSLLGSLNIMAFGDDLPLQALRRFGEAKGLTGLSSAAKGLVTSIERAKARISQKLLAQSSDMRKLSDAINSAATQLGGELGMERDKVLGDINQYLLASHVIERNVSHALLYGPLGDESLEQARSNAIRRSDKAVMWLFDMVDSGQATVRSITPKVRAIREELHAELRRLAAGGDTNLTTTPVKLYLEKSLNHTDVGTVSDAKWADIGGMTIGRAHKLMREIEGDYGGKFSAVLESAGVMGGVRKMSQRVDENLLYSGLLGRNGMLMKSRYNYDIYVPLMAVDKIPMDDLAQTRVAALDTRSKKSKRQALSIGQTHNLFTDRALAPLNEYAAHKKLKGPPILDVVQVYDRTWRASVQGGVINDTNRYLKQLAIEIIRNQIGFVAKGETVSLDDPNAPVAIVAEGLDALTMNSKTGEISTNVKLANLKPNQYLVADKRGRYSVVEVRDVDILRYLESRFNDPGLLAATIGKFTKWKASMVTKFNPAFTLWLGPMRDLGEAIVNLTTSVEGFTWMDARKVVNRAARLFVPLHKFFQMDEDGRTEEIRKAIRDRSHPLHNFAKRWHDGQVQFFVEQFDALDADTLASNAARDDAGVLPSILTLTDRNPLLKRVANTADASEQIVRQAVYDSLIEHFRNRGMDPVEAREKAADATTNLLNYNISSQLGRKLAPLFMFSQVTLNSTRAVFGRWLWKGGEPPVKQMMDHQRRVIEVVDWKEAARKFNWKAAGLLTAWGYATGKASSLVIGAMVDNSMDMEEIERKRREILAKIKAEQSKAKPDPAVMARLRNDLSNMQADRSLYNYLVNPYSFMRHGLIPTPADDTAASVPLPYGIASTFVALGRAIALVHEGRDPSEVVSAWMNLQLLNYTPLNVNPSNDSPGRNALLGSLTEIYNFAYTVMTGTTPDGFRVSTGADTGPAASAGGSARFRFNDNLMLRDAALELNDLGINVNHNMIEWVTEYVGGFYGRAATTVLDTLYRRASGLDTDSPPLQILDGLGLVIDRPIKNGPVRAYYSLLDHYAFNRLRTEGARVLPGKSEASKRVRGQSRAFQEWRKSPKSAWLATYNSVAGRVSREEGLLKEELEATWQMHKAGEISKAEMQTRVHDLVMAREALYFASSQILQGILSDMEREGY